jgi:UDPglucose--hexose-1-phosphate uridylyltransferase
MPEIRIDPLTGLRTVIADAGYEVVKTRVPGDPAPVAEVSPGPTRALDAAVPALLPDAPDPPPSAHPELYWAGPARGEQEPIPNAGSPGAPLTELDAQALGATVERWRERMRAHQDAAYLHLWTDVGGVVGAAGAPPGHAQLVALPFVPAAIARERERFGAYAVRTMGANLLADLLQQEVRARDRLVSVGADAVVLSPYAARVPYQLMIVPRAVRMRFEDEGPNGAEALHDALGRLARRLGRGTALHVWVRTAPQGSEHFCWRIDILPCLLEPDGLALGTGVAVNPVAPERAAGELREG